MKNRIPKELVIAKSTKAFKQMSRGDYRAHKYTYVMESGIEKEYGLVAWKDRDVVYCLTNVCSTINKGICYRRSSNGIVCLERPKVIEEYNTYMGGVDLADMRRLHCNSTIMGQNRWWLKLFFYLLDVGTANALVLYRSSMESTKPEAKLSIVDFKLRLVQSFVGDKINITTGPIPIAHELVRIDSRNYCAYCALFSIKKRTRFKCAACNIPLCSVGGGKSPVDCFALCHNNDEMRKDTI